MSEIVLLMDSGETGGRQLGMGLGQEYSQATPRLMDKARWHVLVNEEVPRALAEGTPLSVLFIDVNYFKAINDHLGHVEGDKVIADLRDIVSVVSGQLRIMPDESKNRENDIVGEGTSSIPFTDEYEAMDLKPGHIGGDEFAVLAKTDEEGASAIEERVRQSFDEYLAAPGNERLRQLGVGLAIGKATLRPGMDPSLLLKRADERMYEDKLFQLPDITKTQRIVLRLSRYVIERSGIRLRDVPKFWRTPDS